MTDNKIIKALKCCLNVDSKCADCHFLFEKHFCKNALLKQTLDLINRQNAEVERLETNNLSMQKTLSKMSLGVEQARAEAIKDFAERLKECTYDGGSHPTVWDEFACAVDNLVKEMIGEQE